MRGSTNLRVRVISCLDVARGRVVKGRQFSDLTDAGNPMEVASHYAADGADEIVYLDICASAEGRSTTRTALERTAEALTVPLTVGGGVRDCRDAEILLRSGADRVAVNSAAVERPELLTELARAFGSQCVVLAIDAARVGDGWNVRTLGGKRAWPHDPVVWAREGEILGAGEILLTSIDRDGTGYGYDLELLRSVTAAVRLPVIASGGVGCVDHLVDGARAGAAALLVAGAFHRGEMSVTSAKEALAAAGIPVRRSR